MAGRLRTQQVAVAVLLLAAALCPSLGGATSHELLLRRPDDGWAQLDIWTKLLCAWRDFSQEHVYYDRDTSQVHGQPIHGRPATLELEAAESDIPEPAEWRHRTESSTRQREAVARAIGPYITPVANRGASKECLDDSRAYLNSILTDLWALRMFDATGKLPDGILLGNANPWGNWDECLNTTAQYNRTNIFGDSDVRRFSGKYCMAFLTAGEAEEPRAMPAAQLGLAPILPFFPGADATVGVCIPSSCTSDELNIGLSIALAKEKISVSVPDFTCYTKDDETEFTAGPIVMITLLSVVGFCMLVGTMIDIIAVNGGADADSLWARANSSVQSILPNTLRKVFLAFSVYTNGRKLLNTSSSADTLGCLHGIRFLSNTWVILGHTYFFLVFFKHRNPLAVYPWFDSVAFQAISNATVSVDSFFFLSGLLVAYIAIRNIERAKGKLNIVMYYVHRYIRLTPVMMAVIGFVATLEVYLGSGPWWGTVHLGNPQICQDGWWKNMLYINNLVDMDTQCIGQTWYLANDMQMFLFSPLVLLPLYHWPVLGQLWIIFLICFFTGINAMITVIHNIGPSGDLPGGDDFNLRYMKPWTRAGPYLVGLYMGWVLHKIRGRRIHLPAPVVVIGWLTASLTACLIVYGLYRSPTVPPETTSVIYGMLNRTAWSVCLAWVVFACVTGYGGVVNSLLSWKALIPLSRLTYTSYLVSIDVQTYYWSSIKSPVYLDQTFVVYQFLASLPMIFAVSLLFSLAFESPMLALEKLIFPQPARAPPPAAAAAPEQQAHVNSAFTADDGRPDPAESAALSPADESVDSRQEPAEIKS